MSRCLHYHPRGYKREDASLIGSIKKLQNGRGHASLTEEKFKKNEIKNKKRSREEQDMPDSSENNKKKRRHDQKASKPLESVHDAGKDPSEQLERSGLTEEHEVPAFAPNSCHSPETTQNSSKMKSSLDSQLIRRSHGLVIRIKLPLKKHNVLCSKHVNSTKLQDLQPLSATEDPCCSDWIAEASIVPLLEIESIGSSRLPKSERCFRDLIFNWQLPSLQLNEADIGDEHWLFSTRRSRPAEPIAKNSQVRVSDRTSCSTFAANSLQCRACYLPECDSYQLPYVIPF